MRNRRKFSLTREVKQDEPVSRLTLIGYSMPSIGLFLILCCFIIDPGMSVWLVIAGWWLALIILISLFATFIRALEKGGILKKMVLTLNAANLAALLLIILNQII